MKKRLLIIISVMLVFGLGIVVYAVNSSRDKSAAATNCCDNCPMKSKDAKAGDKMAMGDCKDCQKGENCPMKKGQNAAGTDAKMADGDACPMMMKDGSVDMKGMKHDMKGGDMKMADGEACPMNKDGSADMKGMKHEMKMDGTKDSCPCGKHKEKKTATPAI